MKGFSLLGLDDEDSIRFVLSYSGADAGREQFFLVSSGSSAVPEPGTITLLGLGLLGAGFASWRRR